MNICKNSGFSVSLSFHVLFSAFLADLIWHKYLCIKRCSPSPHCLLLYILLCGEPLRPPSVVSLCALWSTMAINFIPNCGDRTDVWYVISTLQSPQCQALEDMPKGSQAHRARLWKIRQRAPRFMVPSPGRYTKGIPGSRVEFASSLCVSTCSMGARGLLKAALHPSCLANY